MRKKIKDHITAIETMPDIVASAVSEARTEREMVDVIGTFKEQERKWKPVLAGAIAEFAPSAGGAVQGEQHYVETKRSADRSYNTPNLMTKLQGEGFTLMDLIEHNVIELKWRWTELKNFCANRGIELVVEEKEISPLGREEADVGEYWKDGYPRWT